MGRLKTNLGRSLNVPRAFFCLSSDGTNLGRDGHGMVTVWSWYDHGMVTGWSWPLNKNERFTVVKLGHLRKAKLF